MGNKTIREWLNELEEPYRTQALENMDDFISDEVCESLAESVSKAFLWALSPQWATYWLELHEELLRKEDKDE